MEKQKLIAANKVLEEILISKIQTITDQRQIIIVMSLKIDQLDGEVYMLRKSVADLNKANLPDGIPMDY